MSVSAAKLGAMQSRMFIACVQPLYSEGPLRLLKAGSRAARAKITITAILSSSLSFPVALQSRVFGPLPESNSISSQSLHIC
jgi:hypothetical protein